MSSEDPERTEQMDFGHGWLDRKGQRGYLRKMVDSTLHEFNDPSRGGGWSYKRRDAVLNGIKNAHGGEVTALYSGYIQSLDRIIRFNSGEHFGQRRLGALSYDGGVQSSLPGGLPDALGKHDDTSPTNSRACENLLRRTRAFFLRITNILLRLTLQLRRVSPFP